MGFSDESCHQESIYFLNYGRVFFRVEVLALLFDFPSRGVHIEAMLDDRVLDLRHLIVTPAEHILMLARSLFTTFFNSGAILVPTHTMRSGHCWSVETSSKGSLGPPVTIFVLLGCLHPTQSRSVGEVVWKPLGTL